MISLFTDYVLPSLKSAAEAILLPLPFFALLAIAVKRTKLFTDIRRALPEVRTNVLIHFVDALLVAPLLTVMALAVGAVFTKYDLAIFHPGLWEGLPPALVGLIAIFLGDFIGYWRHRLEHLPLLWPSHAVHHSDTEMTWLAIFRFHPINRLSTTLVDFSFLTLFGLPPYALLVNAFVRHFYGAFIHADLPWTYGPLGKILVSPAMHRWHHANDPAAFNTNYATVFSLFDRLFGTFRVPGKCDIPLGVSDDMVPGLAGQMVHPLRPSSYGYLRQRLRQRSAASRKALAEPRSDT